MQGRLITVFAKQLNLLLLNGLLLLAGLLLPVHQAHAHAAFLDSQPANQATLSTPPQHVQLTFNEPVSALRMLLFAPNGESHPLEAMAQDNQLHLDLPPLTELGSYLLSWRVMSTDGHPIGGSLLFALSSPSNPDVTYTATPTAAHAKHNEPTYLPLAIWLTRWLLYSTLFFGLGSLVFNTWQEQARGSGLSTATPTRNTPTNQKPVNQQPKQRFYLGLVYLGMMTTLVYLALFGLDALALPINGLLQPLVWHTALYSSVGVACLLMLTAFALCCYQPKSPRVALAVAGLAIMLAAASLAATGHASMAPPQWLSRPAVWLHGLAVIAWLSALLPLWYCLRLPLGTHSPLAVFSRYIPLALMALLLSGGVLAYLQLNDWSSFITSRYGQILLAKLTLVGLLLVLGAYNRYRLTSAVLRNEAPARRRLQQVIYAELVLMVLVLSLVALWRFTPPPRSTAVATQSPVIQTIKSSQLQAELELSLDQLLISLYHEDHSPLTAQAVEVRFSNPQIGMEPLHFQAHRFQGQEQADNHWLLTPLLLTPRSHWQVDIIVLVSDFERVTLHGELTLPSKP